MKMAYERPVMHVEDFRANDYVAACNRLQEVVGAFFMVFKNNLTYYFTTNEVAQTNLNDGSTQYYFNEYNSDQYQNPEGTYYLEYSSQRSSMNHKATYFLYQENSKSGYGASSLSGSGDNRRPSNNATVLTSGANSLQMNDGQDGWGLRWDGQENDKNDWWFSDNCLGEVTYDPNTEFRYVLSN